MIGDMTTDQRRVIEMAKQLVGKIALERVFIAKYGQDMMVDTSYEEDELVRLVTVMAEREATKKTMAKAGVLAQVN
jgi:hypothetical protein